MLSYGATEHRFGLEAVSAYISSLQDYMLVNLEVWLCGFCNVRFHGNHGISVQMVQSEKV